MARRGDEEEVLNSCLEKRGECSLYVCNTYGILGDEMKAFNKCICSKLAEKWHPPHLAMMGFIKVRTIISIIVT